MRKVLYCKWLEIMIFAFPHRSGSKSRPSPGPECTLCQIQTASMDYLSVSSDPVTWTPLASRNFLPLRPSIDFIAKALLRCYELTIQPALSLFENPGFGSTFQHKRWTLMNVKTCFTHKFKTVNWKSYRLYDSKIQADLLSTTISKSWSRVITRTNFKVSVNLTFSTK